MGGGSSTDVPLQPQIGVTLLGLHANGSVALTVHELRKLPVAESRYTLQGRVIRDTERSLQVAVAGVRAQRQPPS